MATIRPKDETRVTKATAGDALILDGATTRSIAVEDFIKYGALFAPQGRLTLTSATPVMTTSVAAATTVYYTPYAGNIVPIFDGTDFALTAFAELSQTTADATKSPAACAANSNYDLFVWNDAGTIRCTRGPAWTNDTTRSAGTALVMTNGIFLNNASIANGPAASRGTYVGTIRTNGTSTVDYVFGTTGAGGGMATFGVWNGYNRVDVRTMVADSTDSWTYSTTVIRAANNSATMRVNAVRGLNEDGMQAEFSSIAGPIDAARCGIGVDSTTAFSGSSGYWPPAGLTAASVAKFSGLVGLGYHFVSALEFVNGASANVFYGDAGSPAITQSGFHVSLRA